MRYSLPLLSLFLFLFTAQSFAQHEELSDFEIQKQFKAEYQQFQNKIDTVALADTAAAISDSIGAFGQEYQTLAELLDKALYPETFEKKMRELKPNIRLAAGCLNRINQQDEQVTALQLRLIDYPEHLANLTKDVDSLRQAMAKSIQSEERLSGMVRNYRKNLEERDELILSFIDSTIVAYQKMDLQALKDLESMQGSQRLDTDGDALKMIRDISAENLTILEENSEKLRLDDYVRMQSVQQRFEEMWQKLGDKITSISGGTNAEKIQQQVDNNVAQWDSLLNNKTFAAPNDSLKGEGLQIGDFESGESFYQSLNTHLDEQIKKSQDGSSSQVYEHFKAFNSFWDKVERKWSSNFQNANLMSDEQIAAISRKTDTWAQDAKPESNTTLYVLIGVALLAVVLGGLLVCEKTKGDNETREEA